MEARIYEKQESNQKGKNRSGSVMSCIELLPVFLSLAVIPLVVYTKYTYTKLEKYDWSDGNGYSIDFFMYYKMMLIVAVTVLAVIILMLRLIKNQGKLLTLKMYAPLAVYALLTILSAVFSEYSYFCFRGIDTQYESVWVQTGYCVMAYYAFLMINTEDRLRRSVKWLTGGVTVICIIGILQMAGHDFYMSEIGMKLTMPREIREAFSVTQVYSNNRVYMSLQNPNYVGSYVVLLIPVFTALLLFHKKRYQIFLYGGIILALAACLYGSESRSGIFILPVSVCLIALFFGRRLADRWKILAALAGVFVLVFIITDMAGDGNLIRKLGDVFTGEGTRYNLSELRTNDDNVRIVYKDRTIVLRFNYVNEYEYSFSIRDEHDRNIDVHLDDGRIMFDDEIFHDIFLRGAFIENYPGFQVVIDGYEWNFTNQTDGTYYYYNPVGKLIKLNEGAPAIGFEGKEFFASRRGFIWSRTLPVLSETLLLGVGADAFVFYFPNTDYVAMYNNGREPGEVIMKPHNLYLQIAVQNGIPALMAFLIFYGLYFVWSIRLYWKSRFESYASQLGAGIFIGTVSYMCIGMANDSNITVAPVYWTLLGIGIAANYMSQGKTLLTDGAKDEREN